VQRRPGSSEDEQVDAVSDAEFDEVAVADRSYGAASGGFSVPWRITVP
jgi:hypothetical protein